MHSHLWSGITEIINDRVFSLSTIVISLGVMWNLLRWKIRFYLSCLIPIEINGKWCCSLECWDLMKLSQLCLGVQFSWHPILTKAILPPLHPSRPKSPNSPQYLCLPLERQEFSKKIAKINERRKNRESVFTFKLKSLDLTNFSIIFFSNYDFARIFIFSQIVYDIKLVWTVDTQYFSR